MQDFENLLMENKLNITAKIDGAPAVICWHKFEGYPDDSICLKSFVQSNKNCLSSVEDIEAKYGDRPDMAQKLKFCLELTKGVPAGEAWQGDCLFNRDELEVEEIDGVKAVSFQPNTLVYSAPVSSHTGKQLLKSRFGIAFHTIYKGKFGDIKQSFDVNPKRLKAPKDFFIMSVALDAESTKPNAEDLEEISKLYHNSFEPVANELKNDTNYDDLCNNELFMSFWNTFENKEIADKRSVKLKADTFIEDLREYIEQKQSKAMETKLSKMKTDKDIQSTRTKFAAESAEIQEILDTKSNTINNMVKALNVAAEIKMLLWNIMKRNKSKLDTHVNTRSKGLIKAGMEGAALSDSEGNIVKIVDRTEFSANNRSDDVISGFEKKNRA